MTDDETPRRRVLTFDGTGFEVLRMNGDVVELQLYSHRRKLHRPIIVTRGEILQAIAPEERPAA